LFPELTISYTDDDENPGTLKVRSSSDGRLSYVIFKHGENMNPLLYKFEGKDRNQFEDRYECSPKYTISNINDLLDEIVSKILLLGSVIPNLHPEILRHMF
jgi:hypothetical protein